MREIILTALLLGVAFTGLATSASAETTATATVTLRVAPEGFAVPSHWTTGHQAQWIIDPSKDDRFNDQDGIAGCTVTASDGNGDGAVDGGEVLDEAVATGCISGWESEHSSGFGRFVTSLDGRSQMTWPGPWWALHANGVWSSVGIDGLSLEDGDSLGFIYMVGA